MNVTDSLLSRLGEWMSDRLGLSRSDMLDEACHTSVSVLGSSCEGKERENVTLVLEKKRKRNRRLDREPTASTLHISKVREVITRL